MARARKDRDPYRDAIADLRQQVRDLDRERNKRLAAIDALSNLLGPRRSRRKSPRNGTAARLARQASTTTHAGNGNKPKSMPDAAALILREAGRPLHIVEIIEEMQNRWYSNRTVLSIRGTLAGGLDRRVAQGDGFIKPKPGVYALKE